MNADPSGAATVPLKREIAMPNTSEIDPLAAPSGSGCVECLAAGGWWFHLRRCALCGHIGCCDSSPSQHASKHAQQTGHPVARTFEPGEDWFCNYATDEPVDGPSLAPPEHHPLDQPVPGPRGRVPHDWQSHLPEAQSPGDATIHFVDETAIPIPPSTFHPTDGDPLKVTYVDDRAGLRIVVAALKTSPVVAFDTEFVGERTYQPDLCLLDAATTAGIRLIDPLGRMDLRDFWRVLTDPAREIISVAARQELLFCLRFRGQDPRISLRSPDCRRPPRLELPPLSHQLAPRCARNSG